MAKNHNTIFWINNVVGRNKWQIALLIFIQVVQNLAAIIKILFLGNAVNYLVSKNINGFIFNLIIFIIIILCQILSGCLYRYFNELVLSNIENCFKSKLFDAILNRKYSEIARIHSGEWMNRLTSDTTLVASSLVNNLPEFVGQAIRLIGALGAILWIEPRVLVIIVLGGIALTIFIKIFKKLMKNLHKRIQETDGKLRIFLQERIESLLIVKTFTKEEETKHMALDLMDDHKKARLNRNKLLNIFYSGYSLGVNGAYVLGVIFCGFGIFNNTMSFGSFVAILQLIEQVQAPFAGLTGFIPKYYAMIASSERLMEAENIDEEIDNILDDLSIKNIYDKNFEYLGIKNGIFRYKTPTNMDENTNTPIVLDNFNFEIKKGEHVAFTGPSGCGKSTVLKILMNLYRLDEGEAYIILDNKKQELDNKWKKLFAYVPQGNQLFNGTIRETIAFGDANEMKNEKKIHEAIKIACADDFINKLDNGIDTILGEKGAGLSEGQVQRIAIARAIFSGRPILLLDEVTSALDETVAGRILNNLKIMTDKTVIMVTHRTKNMETFSKIISFSNNKNETKLYE